MKDEKDKQKESPPKKDNPIREDRARLVMNLNL
jgi:hypothetical protein